MGEEKGVKRWANPSQRDQFFDWLYLSGHLDPLKWVDLEQDVAIGEGDWVDRMEITLDEVCEANSKLYDTFLVLSRLGVIPDAGEYYAQAQQHYDEWQKENPSAPERQR